MLENYLTSVAQGFTIARSVRCRACIKLLRKVNAGGGKIEEALESIGVITFSRDAASKLRRDNTDKIENTNNTHSVADNTDFRLIAKLNRSYYLNGDINKAEDYENSSIKATADDHNGGLYRKMLPYRSVLTVPIRYLHDFDEERGGGKQRHKHQNQELLGFLCIDSNARHTFDARYDVQLLFSLADALYCVLDMYRQYRAMNIPNK